MIRCKICREPRSNHYSDGSCMTKTFFTPCTHQRTMGTGCVSNMPEHCWSDATCLDCGERLISGQPPYEIIR